MSRVGASHPTLRTSGEQSRGQLACLKPPRSISGQAGEEDVGRALLAVLGHRAVRGEEQGGAFNPSLGAL